MNLKITGIAELKNPMKYRDRNRKTITLPSGATIVIAKLNTFNEPFIAGSRRDEEVVAGVRIARFCLCNPNNGPLCFDGEASRIVDKVEPGANEITISELEQEDANTIVNEVIVFSGLDSAGREARKTFPEKQDEGREPAPDRQALQSSPDGSTQAAAR